MTSNTEEPFMGPDELRDHLRNWFEENFGSRDLGEGNRRAAVLDEWRQTHG